jgi:hypothetical protein
MASLAILPKRTLIPEIRTSVTEIGADSQPPKKVPETSWETLII